MIDTLRRCTDGNKPGVSLAKKIDALIEGLDQGGSTTNAALAQKASTLLKKQRGNNG
jgi:hypothetical protein